MQTTNRAYWAVQLSFGNPLLSVALSPRVHGEKVNYNSYLHISRAARNIRKWQENFHLNNKPSNYWGYHGPVIVVKQQTTEVIVVLLQRVENADENQVKPMNVFTPNWTSGCCT